MIPGKINQDWILQTIYPDRESTSLPMQMVKDRCFPQSTVAAYFHKYGII